MYKDKNYYMILVGMLFFLISCQSGGGKGSTPTSSQWFTQLAESAHQLSSYKKTVTDLKERSNYVQDSTWTEMPLSTEDSSFVLLEDLEYALETYYKDPYIVELLDTIRREDTLIATLKPEQEGQTDLQSQRIVQTEDGVFQYIASHLRKKNWLYDLEIDIVVHFDSTGLYQHHLLNVRHAVPWIGKDIQAEIKGEAKY